MKISAISERFSRFLPGGPDTEEGRWIRILVLAGIATVALLVLTGFSAFFIALQGTEQTMIPDVRNTELVDALIRLQEKELYPRLQVRYSSDPTLKGKVIDQRPSPGTLVKAGKRITVVVSKGAIVDQVEDFVGREFDEVRVHLQTLFTTYKPLLKIKEPVTYVFNEAPPGTILEQKPAAGTELTGLTDLVLVVSRGPETDKLKYASYVGVDYVQAVSLLARDDVPFVFSVVAPGPGQSRGFVVEQNPPPGTEAEQGMRLELKITAPAGSSGNQAFGLFEYALPVYPVWVDMKFEAVNTSGDRKTLFMMKHPGGPVAIPYYQEPGTTLVLSIFDREVIRHLVAVN